MGAQEVLTTLEKTSKKVRDSEFVTKVVESDVTKTIVHHGKQVGEFIGDKVKEAGDKIDKKIDENPKIAKARDTTKEKAIEIGKFVEKGIGKLLKKIGVKKEQ